MSATPVLVLAALAAAVTLGVGLRLAWFFRGLSGARRAAASPRARGGRRP